MLDTETTMPRLKWQVPLLVFTMAFMVAAYFWMFSSVVQNSPLDKDNSVNLHQGGFVKMAVFDVPIFVSTAPTNYQATIKVFNLDFLFRPSALFFL
jgi:hypothetical protein